MHQYTETESKYTSKIGTHSMWDVGTNVHNTMKLKIMPSEARLQIFEIEKNKHTFYVNNHSPNIFPVLANFALCQNRIPCVFPVWKK